MSREQQLPDQEAPGQHPHSFYHAKHQRLFPRVPPPRPTSQTVFIHGTLISLRPHKARYGCLSSDSSCITTPRIASSYCLTSSCTLSGVAFAMFCGFRAHGPWAVPSCMFIALTVLNNVHSGSSAIMIHALTLTPAFSDNAVITNQRGGRTRVLDVSWGHASARTRVSYVS